MAKAWWPHCPPMSGPAATSDRPDLFHPPPIPPPARHPAVALEQLHQLGIDISAGELSRILTEGKDAFHQEKAELLPAALAVSTYVQVDDTGARHQGHNGFCTHIGNELFASFASTDSKSRLNFLEILRGAAHRLHDQ